MMRLFLTLWLLLLSVVSWANITEHKLDDDVSFWLKTVPSSNTVSIRMSFVGGYFHDTPDKEGTARLAANMLFTGTKKHSEIEFLDALDDGSIDLNFWVSDEHFHASLYALKSEIPQAVDLMFEAMLEPLLSKSSLKFEKQSFTSYLKERDLHPDYKFSIFMDDIIISDDQPLFQRRDTIKAAKRIKQKDLEKYYTNTFAKNHMAITIVGNITEEEAVQLLQPYIAKLPQKSGFEPLDITLKPNLDGNVHVFEQDVQQASLMWLQKGISMRDPSIYTALIFNEWFGGAAGILTKEIREKRGLTYNISTVLQTNQLYQLYSGKLAVDNAATDTAVQNIQAIWQQVKHDNQKEQGDFYLSKEDLERLKKRFANAWNISFTNNAAINDQLISFKLIGYDADSMESFIKGIQNVSYEQMQRFIEQFLHPEELTFFVMRGSQ